ncbi:MAG: hypothetical protein STSR0002_05490 [Smithella sp.]|jgi:hypothetical protein
MAAIKLNAVDKVEILTLQDNYIEITALSQIRRGIKNQLSEIDAGNG